MNIKEQTFDVAVAPIGKISQQTQQEHLNLYKGYVKNTNLILSKIDEYSIDPDKYSYEIGELSRRLSFEYNGVKNHEYYFEQTEGTRTPISNDSLLYKQIQMQWGSWDTWLQRFTLLAKTRGIGWAILYYDPTNKQLFNTWVDEQHIGHLNGCQFILGIDMWEHSYVADYLPSGKGAYISDYLANINGDTVSKRFNP